MLAPVTQVSPLVTIRRRRALPMRGRVLVRAGQEVSATDVIAEANLRPEHVVLDVARGLGLPNRKIGDYVQRHIGEEVTEGDALASRRGLGTRVVRAPANGRVVAMSGGQIMLEVNNKPHRMRARVPGQIAQIEAELGVVIQTVGAWVQGAWGNGPVAIGPLQVVAKDARHLLNTDEITVSLRGAVVLAGHCGKREALEMAASSQVGGLILGSLATQLLPLARRMPYPIVVLEGFGRRPMNQAAFTLLSTNAEREITINAEVFDRYKGTRPEIIIPLPSMGETPPPMSVTHFTPGQRVRIVRAPHSSEVGRLYALMEQAPTFPSGLRLDSAQVEFDDGEMAVVPLANIEVLG
ncbi:MAG: hypothetical protein DWQ07_19845 [Chloroflexi bacterium]|nr:MAG: hypothetical protein DWQ07_19845 [Chloroflexota bacterium]MBL1194337.1 hypothetical protein [Chloroflexota bacterium]NOH11627.1 hypothetical protein [Chloroflexota bacterium]